MGSQNSMTLNEKQSLLNEQNNDDLQRVPDLSGNLHDALPQLRVIDQDWVCPDFMASEVKGEVMRDDHIKGFSYFAITLPFVFV
jgi:hypothetical protein